MFAIIEALSSVDFWKFTIPLLGTVIAWLTNERRKRVADEYQRKEASYKELIKSLRGFYIGAEDAKNLKLEFLNQLNIAWLYCPDEVIKKGYAFLDTVGSNEIKSDEMRENAMGAFVTAIRTDILSQKVVKHTSLTAKDFRHLKVN
jgi:hypothetical protein